MIKKLIRKLTIRLTLSITLIVFMIFSLHVNIDNSVASENDQYVLFEIMFNEAVAQSTCNGETCEITSGCWDAGVREN